MRLGVGVGDVRGDDVDGGGDFAAVEFGQTGGVVENGGRIGGFGGGGVGRALRGYRLRAEMVARGLGLGGEGGGGKAGECAEAVHWFGFCLKQKLGF